MKKVLFLLFLFAFGISGCAQKRLSREEQLAIQERNSAAAVQVYEGYTVDELAKAAEKVLYLIDPSDMQITHQKTRIVACRYYTMFLVFNAVHGYDTWVVYFDENESKVKVTLMAHTAQNMGMFATLPTPRLPDEITLETSVLSEAECRLFFERLDYFLGKTPNWHSCEKTKEWAKEQNLQIVEGCGLPFVCGHNWFGVEDKTPDYLNK